MKLISALARSIGPRWVSLWQLLGARGGEQRSGPWPEECPTKWNCWMLNRREESMQKIADKSVWALCFWFISFRWGSNLQTGRVTCFGASVGWFVENAFSPCLFEARRVLLRANPIWPKQHPPVMPAGRSGITRRKSDVVPSGYKLRMEY